MRRERTEIFKKLDILAMQEEAELELGCGFGGREIAENFRPLYDALFEKLAKTYNWTYAEYMERVFHRDMCEFDCR